jgi:hypothetical protein
MLLCLTKNEHYRLIEALPILRRAVDIGQAEPIQLGGKESLEFVHSSSLESLLELIVHVDYLLLH